ncbi:MAG: exonuclease domain-containing protein [Saprospiraceae bacterium]
MSLYSIIDVETTGGRASRDRITEIAIVLHDGNKVIDTFSSLVNPECPIPPGITELTGITNQMVADAPKFYEIAKQVVEMTEGAVFVAHNVRFDYGFIKEEFARLGYTFSKKQLCTVRLSRSVFPGLPSYSLGNLIRFFNISVEDRHRALADTLATVNLFERIMRAQNGLSEANDFINLGIKETRLPDGITLDFLHNLPETPGVYYFYDENGDVVYVGKSINIRKRVMEHFASQTSKSAKLHAMVRDISFEETGTELIALLLESAEIKKLKPAVNKAQRQQNFPYVIHYSFNEQGYLSFDILKPNKKLRKSLNIVNEYPKVSHARGALYRLREEFELCPQLLGLENGTSACFDYHIKKCGGACVGAVDVQEYNERAMMGMTVISSHIEGNMVICDEGRNLEEKSVVVVEDGELYGFGYFDKAEEIRNPEEFKNFVKPYPSNPEVKKILIRQIAALPKSKLVTY